MLKSKANREMEMPIAKFVKFNESIFYDEHIPTDTYTPLSHTTPHHITPAELTRILSHHFKAEKSSGMSSMPLQLLKHMGQPGIKCPFHPAKQQRHRPAPPHRMAHIKSYTTLQGQGR
jgi:hypothetical protein